jgi:hypothetical protein
MQYISNRDGRFVWLRVPYLRSPIMYDPDTMPDDDGPFGSTPWNDPREDK